MFRSGEFLISVAIFLYAVDCFLDAACTWGKIGATGGGWAILIISLVESALGFAFAAGYGAISL